MTPDFSNLWVEMVGRIIVARVRGVPTAAVIRECQQRILALHRDTGCRGVLYDALELENPPLDIALEQQSLTTELQKASLRIAIVVSQSRTAYLARLAFGAGEHRVFYSDLAAATGWLEQPRP